MTRHTLKPRASAARLARIAPIKKECWHGVSFCRAYYDAPLRRGQSGYNPVTMSHHYVGDIRSLLEGATIVKYSEDDRDTDEEYVEGPDIILTLKKKGVKYRVRIETHAYAAVHGFDGDVPALRRLGIIPQDVYVLPDPPVPDDYRPFLSRFGVVSRREDRP